MKYRSDVGPLHLYDVVGAMQFCRLIELGLRDTHKLLDVGCGSLRAGRLFIAYLLPHGYCGIEPVADRVLAGLRAEVGEGILAVKHPRFLYIDDFDAGPFRTKFDYALCHSVFTHVCANSVGLCLKHVAQVLKPDGTLAATYVVGKQIHKDDSPGYLGMTHYPHERIEELADAATLTVERQDWSHPTGQTWALFRHK